MASQIVPIRDSDIRVLQAAHKTFVEARANYEDVSRLVTEAAMAELDDPPTGNFTVSLDMQRLSLIVSEKEEG